MDKDILDIINENQRRNNANSRTFNPITGEGSIGDRVKISITDFPLTEQWLPVDMLSEPLVKKLRYHHTISNFLEKSLKVANTDENRLAVIDQFVRIRCRHDFAFWAATFVYIKKKGGGADVLFRLNRPQRRYITILEELRRNGKPIRIIMLKARQWGGSTATQIYMAWLQMCHRVGLNSLIIAHVSSASTTIKEMFRKMLDAYPVNMLHQANEMYDPLERKMVGVDRAGIIHRIPQRNCNIQIGTAENPDSCRSGDHSLVHLSEVGVWKNTDNHSPEDIVQSACSGVLLQPYTMIVLESTAKGVGTFFHNEYSGAKEGISQYKPIFVPWYEIENDTLPFETEDDKEKFAYWLYKNRKNNNVNSAREEPGIYLWHLWKLGATLEGIHWYVEERKGRSSFSVMASENPSDDIEAFSYSGDRVFDKYQVENIKASCRPPRFIGDVYGDGDSGAKAMKHVRFSEDSQGVLWIWSKPDPPDPEETINNRYLVVVDVGGRSDKADWSVIVVIDRLFMIDGGRPTIVAQWRGHIDIDILAWKSAQIATYYDNALLVIESNTLETHDRERQVEGNQSSFILNQIKDVYPNLYARQQSQEAIAAHAPINYGFHTNINTKPMIISNLIKVIRENAYVERDINCIEEYLCYEKRPNGSYSAIKGKHDDILMTRAIGLHVCFNEMELPTISHNYKHPGRTTQISEATI
jgi:hypothetical protein